VKLRCIATPDRLTDEARAEIHRLDRILFNSDHEITPADCWWWIVEDHGEAIAFAGLRPCQEPSNAGLAYLIRAGVRRTHRGRGLQRDLIRARVRMARRHGFDEVVTYVMAYNMASANNLIACGFKLYRPANPEQWGGKSALYFRKPLV
jgi:RimJ/RimL family protein N-acetyltransferase